MEESNNARLENSDEGSPLPNHGDNDATIAKARKTARWIHRHSDNLLERLFSHLSRLPELQPISTTSMNYVNRVGNTSDGDEARATFGETTDSDMREEDPSALMKRGLTLPVAAVAWISTQLEVLEWLQKRQLRESHDERLENSSSESADGDESSSPKHPFDTELWTGIETVTSLRYRLNLLRFLLPRIRMIRLNRQPWPPPRSVASRSSYSSKQRIKRWWKKRTQQTAGLSVQDQIVLQANQFLMYAKELQTGGSSTRIDWKLVFPNATILVLEGVPPSRIDLNTPGSNIASNVTLGLTSLRVITVCKAAVYDLHDFLPPQPPTPKWSSASTYQSSLTHLKLEKCSLGELTKGFASCLSQLVGLECLSLRSNEFRKAKTILKPLRTLTKLRYLDLSSNRLMGLFGPHTNLCLGGQVRTLILSNNQLSTCRNSGLEKCYGLHELWLDSNKIHDVFEVSGLAGLPELQCLVLQKNPFSSKIVQTPGNQFDATSTSETSSKEDTRINPFYDPNWKIRLWTWFQQERRTTTPLELPLLNASKLVNHDTAAVDRMTRREWDLIQGQSYSLATTSTTTDRSQSLLEGDETTLASGRVEPNSATVPVESNPIERHQSANQPSLPIVPLRNQKVIKKSKSRKVHILASVRDSNKVFPEAKQRRTKRRPRKQDLPKTNLTKCRVTRVDNEDPNVASSLLKSKDCFPCLLQGGDQNGNTKKFVGSDSTPDHYAPFIEAKPPVHNPPQPSFSLEDVLLSLQHLQGTYPESEPDNPETNYKENEILIDTKQFRIEPTSTPIKERDEGQFELKLADDQVVLNQCDVSTNPFRDSPNNPFGEYDETAQDRSPSATHGDRTRGSLEDHFSARISFGNDLGRKELQDNKSICEDGSDDMTAATDEASNTKREVSVVRSPERRSPRRLKTRNTNDDRIFWKPKVTTIKLNRMGKYRVFDALSSDWDEVIKRASEGRIPDGLVTSPVVNDLQPLNEFVIGNNNNDVFSEQAADLLPSNNNHTDHVHATDFNPASTSHSNSGSNTLDQSLTSKKRATNALPEHIWQDENSVLSSLGASREELAPKLTNKFQLAEENSSYDGPDSSRGMKVVENLQLYFETFVFPTSIPDIPADVIEEMEEDEDDWQTITMFHPRIQLWPDDRRLVEKINIAAMMDNVHWTANRERFCRVWEEHIVPCGKPALRRLPPNRRIRLGFHGDRLFEDSNIDAYSERRKVLLCLSTSALYVIPATDEVTRSHQEQVKNCLFPLPLDIGDRFRDAPWPHAVARHPLGDLEAISIGFEFQRLTLRFRNTTLPHSDPFVYVLLTGDKRATVRICQEIQKVAKDMCETGPTPRNGKANMIAIENDSHIVLESLNSITSNSEAPNSIGAVLHFQIVRQQWKHGDRGTVRRVFVITDTNILLLDEDYAADGHDVSSITTKGEHMADARYRLVDDAKLSLVSQVQAAGSDPRAITIIIKPSTLSRTRRWRLICRDREGAERLVEDARKAVGN